MIETFYSIKKKVFAFKNKYLVLQDNRITSGDGLWYIPIPQKNWNSFTKINNSSTSSSNERNYKKKWSSTVSS